MKYVNIAFYHFFRPKGFLETLRKKIKRLCLKLELKGTVLIAREGINLSVSGRPESIEAFKAFLRELIGCENLAFKESESEEHSFLRMLVKVKKQVIPMEDKRIDPQSAKAPYISPETLKQWLDTNEDFILLDTRNQFEVGIGTFEGAKEFEIDNFRDFKKTLKSAPNAWKSKPVVTFCTGGIRCEKAAPLMIEEGFRQVYQLEGGILNYFKKVGGSHYRGDCFVFDRRIALNTKLKEADVVECYNCRHPVTAEEQKLQTYEYEVGCPYCHGKAQKTLKS